MIQKIREVWESYGSYYDFQSRNNMDSLDLGVWDNASILSWLGVVGEHPFVNSKDCLSLLDWRVFFINDTSLQNLQPRNDFEMQIGSLYSYMPEQEFVLWNEYKEFALNYRDHLRDYRLLWLLYRIHKAFGSKNEGRNVSELRDELIRSL
jgi:hypothetical protein